MKDFKNLTFDELQAEIARIKTLPEVVDYLTALQELQNKKQEIKKEVERKQQVKVKDFISKLCPIIIKAIKSVKIPNRNDAWLTEFPEWSDDIKIDTNELETFLLTYFNKTGAEVFRELAYNVVIRLEANNTIYLAMVWDDDHYYDDQIEFEYKGNFNSITSYRILNDEITKAFK